MFQKKFRHIRHRSGVTLIEILVVMALVVVFGAISLLGLVGRKNKTEVESTAQKIAAALREAQSNSMSQASGTSWGVRFWNTAGTPPFLVMFTGSSYSSSGEYGGRVRLSDKVAYVTSTLPSGSYKDIIFDQITGKPSVATSVGVAVAGGGMSSTISISSAGLINLQ